MNPRKNDRYRNHDKGIDVDVLKSLQKLNAQFIVSRSGNKSVFLLEAKAEKNKKVNRISIDFFIARGALFYSSRCIIWK